MKTLKIGDLLAKVPIVQGGMGVGISLSGLASAVANAGGVGVISSAGLGVIYKEYSNDFKGRMENGYAFAGSNAWRTEKILSVRELIQTLKDEFEAKRASLKSLL